MSGTGSGTTSHTFQEQIRDIAGRVERVQASSTQHIYGTIIGFARDSGGGELYKVQIRPDGDPTSSNRHDYVLLGDDAASLASNYGAPHDLVGKRVKIVFRGGSWTGGLAYIVGDRSNQTNVRNHFDTSTNPFSWAPPGSGI